MAPYSKDCAIVFDVERVAGEDARMDALSVEERTDLAILFCETVKAAGYKPMIYFNTEMAVLYLELDRLEEYDKWFAAYADEFYYPYAYSVWQYSESGTVDGIDTPVDMNLTF